MYRLFVAIDLPEDVRDRLLGMMIGIPGARWSDDDQLHLTLRFIGEVDGHVYDEAADALGEVEGEQPFELRLAGAGHFPPRGKPRSLWVGVERSEELVTLRERIERRLVRAGLEPERRKFHPHVTLARFQSLPAVKVAQFLGDHALYRSRPFEVDAFHLYRSHLRQDGADYTCEQSYPLG